jgi:N-acetylglucosaminyl-diphospho-decaprenol L-rhamnosyltransferase
VALSPRVTVVVVTWHPGPVLARLLDSVPASCTAPVAVVLADNGDPSAPLDPEVAAAARRPDVRVCRTGGNLGYGRAVNAAAADLATEFLLVANQDLEFAPGALDVLLAAADAHPEAVAFGPRILTPGGELYPSARDLPSLGRGLGHAALGWWWPGNPWTVSYRRETAALTTRPAGWLSGSCLLVRRSAWSAVGGFDPRYFMYFEDVDLGERLGRVGVNLYVPDAVVTHVGGTATARDPRRMARAHHDSAWLYLAGRYPGPRWWPLRLALRAGLAARAALAERVRPVAAGARLSRRSREATARELRSSR